MVQINECDYQLELVRHLYHDKTIRDRLVNQQFNVNCLEYKYQIVAKILLDRPSEQLTRQYMEDLVSQYKVVGKQAIIGVTSAIGQAAALKPNHHIDIVLDKVCSKEALERIKTTNDKEIMAVVAKEALETAKENGTAPDCIAIADTIEAIKGNMKDVESISDFKDKPLNLQGYYNNAPRDIKRLTELLYSLNPCISASAHYITALHIVGAIIGKRLIGKNMGRTYYTNSWLSILAPTASNKSFITTIERLLGEVINENIADSPVDIMQDRFTMSSAFYSMGSTVDNKTWASLSENDQMKKKSDLRNEALTRKAKVVFSDEFAYTFDKIISSGVEDKEMGSVLKLADSGSTINGSTGTNGYRVINDCCVSIIGYTQPDNWHKKFDTTQYLDSGLIGRFFIMNIADYSTMKVEPVQLNNEQIENEIRDIFRAIINKVNRLPKRVICSFYDTGKDFAGDIVNEIIASEPYQTFIRQGLLPIDKIKGKVIYQAIKYCMIDRFLRMDDKAIESLSNGFADEVISEQFRDEFTYCQYSKMILNNAIKLFMATDYKSEYELLEEKIYKSLLSCKGKLTIRDIQRKSYKLGNYFINSNQTKEIVNGMAEKGYLIIKETKKGSMEISMGWNSPNK